MSRKLEGALASGLLLGLCFPPYKVWPLAWVALIPLLIVPAKSLRHSFFEGWKGGTVYHLIVFSWLWRTFHAANIGVAQTFFVWLLLGIYMGIYLAVFSMGANLVRLNFWAPFFLGALWVALDYLKTYLLTGFPWAFLAHSQMTFLPMIQIASVTGAEGVSFLIVLLNASVALFLRKRISLPAMLIHLSFPLAALIFGFVQLRIPSSPQTLSAVLLQPNVDPYQKWDRRYETDIRTTFEKLTSESASSHPDLIVWPEASVPGWYPNEPFYYAWVSNVVKNSGAPNLVGAASSVDGRDTNSAFLVDSSGVLRGRYEKRHLVPFGEYIPFGNFASKWIPYLGQLGTFLAGSSPALFPVGSFSVAPSVCYEIIFSDLIRRDVKSGAQVLANITNDGWYLDTGAPEQHLSASVFRAVENHRPVIRAANTGISAAIDARGRFLFRSPLNRVGAYLVRVPVPSAEPLTIYTRAGPWFSWLCLGLVLVGAFVYCRPHVPRT